MRHTEDGARATSPGIRSSACFWDHYGVLCTLSLCLKRSLITHSFSCPCAVTSAAPSDAGPSPYSYSGTTPSARVDAPPPSAWATVSCLGRAQCRRAEAKVDRSVKRYRLLGRLVCPMDLASDERLSSPFFIVLVPCLVLRISQTAPADVLQLGVHSMCFFWPTSCPRASQGVPGHQSCPRATTGAGASRLDDVGGCPPTASFMPH